MNKSQSLSLSGRTVTLFLLVMFSSTLSGRTFGADLGEAQALVENTTRQVVDTLKKNKERLQNDKPALYQLVNEIIVPHFDFVRMARLVLGKNWRNANTEQKKRFAGEFKTLLVRTYSTAMLDFTDEKINYLPIRGRGEGDSKALSRMEISQPGGGPPVQMQLRMAKRKGAWMVYDIAIDGVSLVTNYRQSFNNDIQASGIDGLINKLIEKNGRHAG
ncbi:MAG: MlaC/ttg2D family ABC transporter substrate-binding protein [Gammaproteobacteria bacterium]